VSSERAKNLAIAEDELLGNFEVRVLTGNTARWWWGKKKDEDGLKM